MANSLPPLEAVIICVRIQGLLKNGIVQLHLPHSLKGVAVVVVVGVAVAVAVEVEVAVAKQGDVVYN
jgi:hypothetical protein